MILETIIAATLATTTSQSESAPTPLKCDVGPVSRTFGGSEWMVYSCDDGASMVAVTAAGNPASPFIFILMSGDDGYKIMGEGNGDQMASSAAGDEISRMTADELAALLAATKSAANET